MKSSTFIALLIVVLIIAAWFIHYLYDNGKLPQGAFYDTYEYFAKSANYKYNEYFTPANKLYEKTTGYEFDDTAKLALDKAKKSDDMYTNNEALGTMSQKNVGDAATNSFIVASLYNYNVAPNTKTPGDKNKAKRTAAAYFNKTLRRISRDPVAVDRTTPQPVEFIVDRAQDFWDDYLIQIQAEDPNIVNNIYIPNFENIRTTIRENKAANVPKAQYFHRKPLPSDPQNVHDSQVNNDMKNIVNNIHSSANAETALGEMRIAINQYPFTNSHQRNAAREVVDTMGKGDLVTSLGVSERDLITDVWNRINHKENSKRRGSLRESFMTSLTECKENGKVLCTMGRCARVLGALTLLDSNPEIAKPMKTKEIMRDEAFSKAHKIVQDILKATPKNIVDAYNSGPNTQISEQVQTQIHQLEADMRTKIETTLREDYKDSNVASLNTIISDALAGV